MAFLEPVGSDHFLEESVGRIKETLDNLDSVYEQPGEREEFNTLTGEGNLQDLAKFAGVSL
jgi:hypothetical protein